MGEGVNSTTGSTIKHSATGLGTAIAIAVFQFLGLDDMSSSALGAVVGGFLGGLIRKVTG